MAAASPVARPRPTGLAANSKRKGVRGGEAKTHEDQFIAAAIGDVEWLRQSLRESGAPGLFDRNGLAAVHLAAIHGRLECLRLLIEHHGCDVNSSSSTGWRPVHLCISSQTGPRSLQCLLYLLEKGADHSCANADLVTPAHQAASEGHLQALQLLIKIGARLDQTDTRGFRPIDMAKIWGHQKCARLLATEIWHRDKDLVAKKLNVEKRVAMKELLRQFEKEEKLPNDLRYKGKESLTNWVQRVEESKSQKKPSKKEQQSKPAQLLPVPAEGQSSAETTTSAVGFSIRAQIREAIEEANEVLDETRSGDQKRTQLPDRAELRLASHPYEWNKSTKVSICFHPYQKSLEDVYPRDPLTRMPHPRNSYPHRLNLLSGHPEATLVGDRDRGALATVAARRQELDENTDEAAEAESDDEFSDRVKPSPNSRGQQLFACKSVLDIQRRKRLDELVRKYRGEAAAHLTSDLNSFLFRDALGLPPVDKEGQAIRDTSAASHSTEEPGSRALSASSKRKTPA